MLTLTAAIKWKLQSSTFLCYCLTCKKNVIQSFESVDEIVISVKAPSKYRKDKVELFINYAVLCITVFKVS